MAKVREVIARIQADGWYLDHISGSHRIFKHPDKPGTVTVPGHPGDELHPKTERSILRQAGLLCGMTMQAHVPHGFTRDDEEDVIDGDALATEFGWIDGYRVIYHQLAHNWDAYSPDVDGVVTTGTTRREVERNMREAIPIHLEAQAADRRERPWLYASDAL